MGAPNCDEREELCLEESKGFSVFLSTLIHPWSNYLPQSRSLNVKDLKLTCIITMITHLKCPYAVGPGEPLQILVRYSTGIILQNVYSSLSTVL